MAESGWCPFRPTSGELAELARDVEPITAIQSELLERHPDLHTADRVAHQYQIAGGRVELTIANQLPEELKNLGIFVPDDVLTGLGRLSTGLGVPHLETNPDFLGIMLAFMTPAGQRVDLLGINDPTAPTDTHQQFVSLLRATADAAGSGMPLLGDWGEYDIGNLLAEQTELVLGLKRELGLMGSLKTWKHLLAQTSRTFRSNTAYQPYWSGILEAGDTAGKFTLIPVTHDNEFPGFRPGERYLSEEWRTRLSRGPIEFSLEWIRFLNQSSTSTTALTEPWSEDHRTPVARLRFLPPDDPDAGRYWALLTEEMGANPGHWISHREVRQDVPGTQLTAARQLAYTLSQQGRNALPAEQYASVFSTGIISTALASELDRRASEKEAIGHIFQAPS